MSPFLVPEIIRLSILFSLQGLLEGTFKLIASFLWHQWSLDEAQNEHDLTQFDRIYINYTDCYWKQISEPLTLGAHHNNFNYTKGSISCVKTFQLLPFLLSYFKSGQNYKVVLKTQDGVEGYFPSSEIPPPNMHTVKPSLAGITFISSSWRNFWRAFCFCPWNTSRWAKWHVKHFLEKGDWTVPVMCILCPSFASVKVLVVQEYRAPASMFK